MMSAKYTRIMLAMAYFFFTEPVRAEQTNWGRYDGAVVARFLDDGRNLQIEKSFVYTDPNSLPWEVPAGTVTDGASVPRFFWSVLAPFSGKYRAAAVVHDYYCQTRSRVWQQTHQTFYTAMRASGVDEITAKTMYGAVYAFGPRWGIGASVRGPASTVYPSELEQEAFYRALTDWIALENPTIQEITNQLDKGVEIPIRR